MHRAIIHCIMSETQEEEQTKHEAIRIYPYLQHNVCNYVTL